MKAHVICMNDSVEHVVIDDEALANTKLDELRKAYFDRNQHVFHERDGESAWKAYLRRIYWHIHTVEVTCPTSSSAPSTSSPS